jgi:hypothetical protein
LPEVYNVCFLYYTMLGKFDTMKKFLLSIVAVFLFVGVANAQFAVHMSDMSEAATQTRDAYASVIYPNIDTATVVAVGGLVDPVNIAVVFKTAQSGFITQAVYTPRKATLHKMAGDDRGPEKAWIWVRSDGVGDPGRGRFKTIIIPNDGPNADGYWQSVNAINGNIENTNLTVILVPDDVPSVTLMCADCGHVYTEYPLIDKDGNLVNSICPVCGGVAITSDTLTPEVADQ